MAPPTTERDVLDEIREERTITGRGQSKPRGVKRKMSNLPISSRGPLSRKVHELTPEIRRVAP